MMWPEDEGHHLAIIIVSMILALLGGLLMVLHLSAFS